MRLARSKSTKSGRTSEEKRAASSWVQRNVTDGRPYYFNTSRDAGIDNIVSIDKPVSLMTGEERAQREGEYVWVPHPEEYWQPAKLLKRGSDGAAVVQVPKGPPVTIPANGVVGPGTLTGDRTQQVPLWPVNWTAAEWQEDDIIKLQNIDEASILYNLKRRYEDGEIYTWVGANNSVLLSINPYQRVEGLYSDETMSLHKSIEHKPDQWAPPHVYNVTNSAYDDLCRSNKNQSILVSGESGAGKTEATKHALEFLAEKIGSDAEEHHIADKLLLSNPLLEAFGNAVTLRNNNSSRFGKYIEVNFSRSSGRITGASFRNFMLEAVRVVSHQKKERNFHIFYQLLQDEQLSEELNLGSPKEYAYLNQSKTSLKPQPDDAENFKLVQGALSEMEFTTDEIASMWRILAGLLNAGNLTFKDAEQASGVTGSKITNEKALEATANLWSLDPETVRKELTSRTFTARGETSTVVLDAAAAKDAVDALCKSVYNQLFQALVRRVNASMAPPSSDHSIGLLDIFGFEVLKTNGFEQLCINYCNEKLQQFHNMHTFDSEEAFYKREGVEYSFLEPRNNQKVLDLLEKKPKGLFITLDDEGALPGGSDKSWLGKAEKVFENNKLFKSDFRQKFESSLTFQVVHFAGEVRYNATNFVKKNKDTMWANLYSLMSTSEDGMIRTIFPEGKYISNTKPVAAQFRINVNDLLSVIRETECRYIRCLKPNDRMQPEDFDAKLIVEQLSNSGVYEIIELRKGGFPFRVTHKHFAFMYGCINIKHLYDQEQLAQKNWRNICAEILNLNPQMQELSDDIRIGEHYVLYRVNVHKPLVLARNLAVEIRLPKVQAFIRGSISRHYTNQLHVSQGTLREALETKNDIELIRKGYEQATSVMEWLKPNLSFLPPYPMFLYNKCEQMESGLMAFEDLEAAMRAATDNVAAEDVKVDLYFEMIEMCKEADTELSGVARTAAQEKLYAHLQDLIANSEPGKMDAEAMPALESLDRARMQAVQNKADEIGYQTETVDKIGFILERLEFLDIESKDAVAVLDGHRMKACLDEANMYLHTNESLREMERLFELDEEEFVNLELEAAKRLGDKVREIHRRIRLKEIFYDKFGDKFLDTWSSGHVREPMEYAAASGLVLCGRGEIARGMKTWSPKPLATTLTYMPGEIAGKKLPKEPKEIKLAKKQCKATFINIQKYMGDKKVNEKKAELAGEAVVKFGFENPDLRNEVYFQLIKQLTKNEDPESVARGYELLGFCMSQFLPSDGMEDYLVMWVRRNPGKSGSYKHYTSALHKLQFDDNKSAKVQPMKELRKQIKQFSEEGSRFSIAVEAFTGPTAAKGAHKIPEAPDEVKKIGKKTKPMKRLKASPQDD